MPAACSLVAMGMINALGGDAETIWRRVLRGGPAPFAPHPELTSGFDGLVGAVDDAWLPRIPDALARYACRNNAFSLRAFEQIEDAVRDVVRAAGPERVGVVMGTSTSGSASFEATILGSPPGAPPLPEFQYAQLELGGTAGFLAELLDLRGPAFSISTACSSSARALVSARSLLALGLCDAVLAGGSDSLCALTTYGFASLKALARGPTNPFSVNRDGLTLGEGAALFLVTRDAGGIQLVGAGESSEAHHISSPDPEGIGALASMRGALRDAGAQPEQVAYLNLHGTGTKLNDAMESRAVAELFGPALPCSSTKPLVGHCLGAAGAIELGFCWLALEAAGTGALPLIPHCWDGAVDPELAPLRLAGRDETQPAKAKRLLMTNSFGFGGNNCTLLIGDAAR